MFYTEEKSNIKYKKSSVLENENLVHAFTTRIGGNTPYPLNTFSLGMAGQFELKSHVLDNRQKICEILGLDYGQMINPDQQHTDNIKIVTGVNDDVSATDGVITRTSGLVLMLLFADCTPIILFAPKEKVLGIIHAGWKGTAKKIASKAVSIFQKDFNVDPNTINAAIGPAIGQCCYPVSIEVAEELKKSIKKNHDNIFKNNENDSKINVDLKRLNARQLIETGVTNIDISDDCTSCQNLLFYSYRADKGKTGRHAAIASLK